MDNKESLREWTFVGVFALSRLVIHSVRPFLYDPRLPYGWAFPLQYAHIGNWLAQGMTAGMPLPWVMRFFEFIYMGMTLATASLMNEIMVSLGVSRKVRTGTLYAYIFWFGTIQSETWFYYPHGLALVLMFMIWELSRGQRISVWVTGIGVMLYRTLYNPLLIFTPIGKLCAHNMTRYMPDYGVAGGYLLAVLNAVFIFFSFTANQYFSHFKAGSFWINSLILTMFWFALEGYWNKKTPNLLPIESFSIILMVYTLIVSILIGFNEANYYRLPIDPLIWMGLGLWVDRG
jgi:hypothetical protein